MSRIVSIIFFSGILALPLSAQSNTKAEPSALLSRPADFPTPPKTNKSLFFIQRNKNKNTIVYDANLKAGKFDSSKPIDAYWQRYASTGLRGELTWTQKTFAYGYSSKKDAVGNGYYITLTAYDKRKIHLQLDSKGQPFATMLINGKNCRLNYIWVFADNSSKWPDVIHVDLHGTELGTSKKQTERIQNN
ncbi:MAG: DUF4833 domain-containing protein [Bacteroidetes bacterium]|nr:DUF4833 domain-containing protein [Bacteroidota bacterium]